MPNTIKNLSTEAELFFKRMKDESNVVLNSVQLESCLHVGTQLLLAAPGTGKTTTTITKIGYMIEVLKVNPATILAVTFSKAAALDMQARFSKFFPEHPDGIVHFSTIHALSYEIFRKYMAREKLSFRLIEGQNSKTSAKTAIISKIYEGVKGEYPSEEIRESLQSYISLLKNLRLTPSKFKQLNKEYEILDGAEDVFLQYEEYKRNQAERLIDYDDMLESALTILENDDKIRDEYQSRFSFLLMDEAQDTSYIQHCIAEILAEKHQNLFMVADDDQTIYGFRGSDVANLLVFQDKYPSGKILKMEHNYRSNNNIVKTANQFIRNVKQRFDKNMYTHKPDGSDIVIERLHSHTEQMDKILKQIKQIDNLSEVAILYRNNSSSIAVAHKLMQHNIPFYVKDVDSKFFNHFIMTDLRNYLRLAYGDKVKHMKLVEDIRSRFKGYVTTQHLKELATYPVDDNLWDSLSKIPSMKPYQKAFFKECKVSFTKMKNMKPVDAINMVLDDLGYEKCMDKYIEFIGMNKESTKRVLSTIKGIAEASATLVDFYKTLDDLANAMKSAKENQGKNAVTLSTFHASKGLEYETVFLIDLQEGQCPSLQELNSFNDGNETALDEAYRLFYVAMTRAKENLYLYSYKLDSRESSFLKKVEEAIRLVKKPVSATISTPTTNVVEEKKETSQKVVVSTQTNSQGANVYNEGAVVTHRSFGAGVIMSLQQDIITVNFKGMGVKTLSLSQCLKTGLIKV